MSTPSLDALAGTKASDALELSFLTWMGLILAGIGWVLLIGEAARVDVPVVRIARPLPATFHADLFEIAKCVIASGFALAIVGALQTGFGTLNRFFSAVLARSVQRAAPAPRQEPVIVEPAAQRCERRPYRTLADGSVEVDTILGTRRFQTMSEAREFI